MMKLTKHFPVLLFFSSAVPTLTVFFWQDSAEAKIVSRAPLAFLVEPTGHGSSCLVLERPTLSAISLMMLGKKTPSASGQTPCRQ